MTDRREDGYEVSTDPARLDVGVIHGFLVTAYWCAGIARETVERAITGSIPFGLYAPDGAQAGFARVVTDRATFAYLGDVFVLEEHRGRQGLPVLAAALVPEPDRLDRSRLLPVCRRSG